MSPKDKVAVLQAFAISAAYYGRNITDDVAAMYLSDVSDLPAADVLRALTLLRQEPKRRTCPLPSEVRALLARKDGVQSAEQVASRIAGAMSMFGWNNGKKARAYIGEAGWSAVQEMGGWASICGRLDKDDVNTFTAQAREVCRAHVDAAAMTRPVKDALPEATQSRLKVLAGGVGTW